MDTTEILIKIRRIVRSINLESKKIQKIYGVSIPQILCLGYLQKSEYYQATQGAIARFLNLNQSTVNGIIKRLEAKGLIARLPKSGDKRVVRISLTSDGDKLLKKISPLLHDRLSSKLEKLDEKELQDKCLKGQPQAITIIYSDSWRNSPVPCHENAQCP